MTPVEVRTPAGVLVVRRFGGVDPRIVALHGFGLHGGQFAALAAAGGWRVDAPDLPGHGRTDLTPVDLDTTVAVLASWLGESDGDRHPERLIGYSQGGRLALHLARRHPEVVGSLAVISAGPGLDGPIREDRARDDAAVADLIEGEGIASYLDAWLDHPVFGTSRLAPAARAADRALRMENDPRRLAEARRRLGQGALPRVPLEEVPVPILWIAGQLDPSYVALMRTAAALRDERIVVVPGVGHNVVAEAPAELAAELDRWFASGR